ncbi:DUF3598 family protein [Leptolyngbya sp. AN02str]|uniref:DUF3598 family protein n=1 Tax=Leptolyngbya sp. AN02str TaxID=3423363 RepID=UPI003D311811
MNSLVPSAQWLCLLQHLGAWHGSFTRLDAAGILQNDTPTVIELAGLDGNQTVRQTLNYFSPDTKELVEQKVLEYRTLNRGVLFFGNGAFSQGSLQYGPFSEFGAEFGFLEGDRRLRLVPMFAPSGSETHLASITLIREHLPNSITPERPPLTVEALVGTWRGQAVTLYADWRSPDEYSTTLTVQQQGDRLHQQLTMPQFQLQSSARIEGSRLLFDQGTTPMQLLLLPDGGSCNTPLTIPKGKPFLLETGWLVTSTLRQRLVRQYDAQGGWVSLTLVVEEKVD